MLTALRELDRDRRLGTTLALAIRIDKLVQAECELETFPPLPTDRNHAIQRSRACNVSQKEDQLSRPADRYRSVTDRAQRYVTNDKTGRLKAY